MTDTLIQTEVDLDPVKAKHRAMWALGDYDMVATEVVAPIGERLVDALAIDASEVVLDVAAGSGNASLPAARRGARVVATDLTPELLRTGRIHALADGLELEWRQADAEYLPFEDARFDVTMAAIGVMFAPFHQPVADELIRVTRPGGRIGLVNWTPEGFIGQMFTVMKPFAPPPPPGAQPGPLWGREEHVRSLLGDGVRNLTATTGQLRVENFTTGEEFRDFFKRYYGPTIAVYRSIADQPERVAQLDRELCALAERFGVTTGRFDWEYLLVVADRT